ncbi:MAG TPA: methylated-DNA--[protein]-cysteine S-methyltransferase [Gemmatimonadales bacterium]|nr:methylated-DNA--[protein]-cysteine S-methyltransferase [Gemmatimonadales bacterium]
MNIHWTSYPCPVGPLTLVECEAGALVVEFPARALRLGWQERVRALHPRATVEMGPCAATREWLDGYFAGQPAPFPFPYHLGKFFDLSPAQVVVARALWEIPFGETRSYDDIARATGLHPRQVGQLVGANHLAICIPCHRVVGKQGDLVGYGGGLPRKRWLLDHELRAAGLVLRSY